MGSELDLLEQLAADINVWFPELQGRAIAVSDAKPTKQNLPGLPMVMVSFANEITAAGRTTGFNLSQRSQAELIDTFVVEFWLKTSRSIEDQGKSETPFWAYYRYQDIRDKLLTCLTGYLGPKKERVWYVGLAQETAEYAVILVFTFQSHYNWCPDDAILDERYAKSGDGFAITDQTIKAVVCRPKIVCCPDPDCETKEKEDPCQ